MTFAAAQTAKQPRFGMDMPYLVNEWRDMLRLSTILPDLWAGVTVALVALPLNLALAIAAGVEPAVGITTGIIAGIIGSLLGGQRFAITGPAAAMAVVLIEIAQTYGIRAIWLVGVLAGAMQILAGTLRLGRLINYIPMPVMVGFANAIGTLVFFNALDDFFGLPTKPLAHPGQAAPFAGHPLVPEFIQDVSHLIWRMIVHQEVNFLALCLGVVALAIAVLTPRVTKAVPGQLVAILVTTLLASLINFDVPKIADISSIPNLLPFPRVPDLPWEQFDVLFMTSITVFMLGSIESLLSASVADGMTMSRRHHSDQELIGQGLANVVVTFFGGIPVTGVIARTAVNIRAGARTRAAGVVHSVVLAILIFFLARYAEQIPLASLAAILILTGVRLIEWDEVKEIWRASRMEGYVVLATTVVSVAMDLTVGVITGLIFTCGIFIRQMSAIKLTSADQDSGNGEVPANAIPCCKYVRTYLLDGPLFFGAAERFIENILIVQDIKVLILHMRAVNVMDLTGVQTLLSIHRQLKRRGARLVLAELPPQPRQLLERTRAMEELGAENLFFHYREAKIEANKRLIETTCQGCADPKARGVPTDCRLRHALLTDPGQVDRLFQCAEAQPDPEFALSTRLKAVDSEEAIPELLRNTPIGTLLRLQNLQQVDEGLPDDPQLLVGMCIDYRKRLALTKSWAYILRREGANMAGSEFAVALAASKGLKYMALIAHNHCAMANTGELRSGFVSTLISEHGWNAETAQSFFEDHARSREIGNEIDFVLHESRRLKRLFSGLTVVPLIYLLETERLYLLREWLEEALPDASALTPGERETGGPALPDSGNHDL